MLKLGAQLYTLRKHTQSEGDFAETIAKVAKIGYKYAQVSGIGAGIKPEFIKKVTEDNGVKVILTHTSLDRICGETERVIEEHDIFGCPCIGVGGFWGARTAEGFRHFAEEMAPVVAKIKAAGKLFLYHNHRFEFEQFEKGKSAIDIMLEHSDKSAFKLTFDTYWAHAGGIDSAQFIKDYKDNIFATHLKDMTVRADKAEQVEILDGNMNFGKILKVSEKHGVLWHFVELDEVYMDAFESMRISYYNLMATGMFEV